MRSARAATVATVFSLLLAACGSGSFPVAGGTIAPSRRTTTVPAPITSSTGPTSTTPATSTSAAATVLASTTVPASTARTTLPAGATTSTPTTAGGASPTVAGVPQLAQAGSANQAIVVTATGYQVNDATLTAYTRTAGGWVATFGPWPARIGYAGFAPPGQKMEGDGRTPSGAYGFDFMFGVSADPGVKFAYRHITTQTIVWDDDPKSALYNEWADTKTQDAGSDPEDMYQPLAYQYGAVIAYNSARTPGLGSAIFLHATIGGPTAGCVSIATDQLVQVLEWLDPAQSPRIIMGVA